MMQQIEDHVVSRRGQIPFGVPLLGEDRRLPFRELWSLKRTLFRSSFLGFTIGILPGLGATIASFMGYVLAKRASPDGDKFGEGQVEGVLAAEAADSAVSASALIPLLALGIPGSVAAAILMGAFMIHGFAPGPLLFEQNIEIVYGIYVTLILGSVSLLVIGRLGLTVFSQVTRIPQTALCPIIVVFCVIGAYADGNSMFAVGLMMVFGVMGYAMRKLGLSFVALLIGFILGPMVELTLRQSMILLSGDYAAIIEHPVAIVFAITTPIIAWKLSSVSKNATAG
jgi:putative tricarboxylic transport membrane protein